MRIGRDGRRLADTVILRECDGTWSVDGVEMPWYLQEKPEVDTSRNGITIVHLPLIVEGVVTIIDADQTSRVVIDPVLGDVGDWATDYVNQQLRERISWLTA